MELSVEKAKRKEKWFSRDQLFFLGMILPGIILF